MLNTLQNYINPNTYNAIKVTLILAFCSTGISTILGVFFGLLLEEKDFRLKGFVLKINRTLMAIPPVVAGLLIYLLLMRRGPLGKFRWLFTLKAMILAQVVIITPIITGMIYSYASNLAPRIREFVKAVGGTKKDAKRLLLKEMRDEIYFTVLTGFGRSMSEVGAVMLVGGNIKGKTRTMTTTISLLKSQGIYTDGVFLGVTLLLITFVLQLLTDRLSPGDKNANY